MAIEALLFDLGKVLVDFDFDLSMRHFGPRSPLSHERFKQVVFEGDWLMRYETGAISTPDFHRYLCENAQLEMDIDEFLHAWSAVFLPGLIIPEAFLAALKQRY